MKKMKFVLAQYVYEDSNIRYHQFILFEFQYTISNISLIKQKNLNNK